MISLAHILIALLGVVAGIIFGAIPGMTATMAVAVFLPMTYAYDLNMALYLLLGLYGRACPENRYPVQLYRRYDLSDLPVAVHPDVKCCSPEIQCR